MRVYASIKHLLVEQTIIYKTTEDTESTENMELNGISEKIIGAAMQVHSTLGPGLLESAYEASFTYGSEKRGIKVLSQVGLPVIYDGMKVDLGYRLDLLVEDSVIVELKAVNEITPVYEAQLISYLKLSGKSLGLLINFNVTLLKDGITRRIN
ncbi:MAG: PD-(D/E)XK nuclease superfamily protein [Candidatus Argoarchaeum ethanivorans]|uniref:PD-(D/E)XK nuclease superfamily protein n=1 Tax=Candidatus Argoarchaeum ethanivorans TaxID=2608793 RepID=A0A811TAJ2_9EURY|nr:MAG: PD-(D/E)XK nuclease superfamily protein [Candidatus Argoarchaeum ethanivorans]